MNPPTGAIANTTLPRHCPEAPHGRGEGLLQRLELILPRGNALLPCHAGVLASRLQLEQLLRRNKGITRLPQGRASYRLYYESCVVVEPSAQPRDASTKCDVKSTSHSAQHTWKIILHRAEANAIQPAGHFCGVTEQARRKSKLLRAGLRRVLAWKTPAATTSATV